MKHAVLKIKNRDFKIMSSDFVQYKGKIAKGVRIFNLYNEEIFHFTSNRSSFKLLRNHKDIQFDIYVKEQLRGSLFKFTRNSERGNLFIHGHTFEVIQSKFQGKEACAILQDNRMIALMLKNTDVDIFTMQSDKTALCAMVYLHLRDLDLVKLDKEEFALYIETEFLSVMSKI